MPVPDSLDRDPCAMNWLKLETSLRQGQKEKASLSVRILIFNNLKQKLNDRNYMLKGRMIKIMIE